MADECVNTIKPIESSHGRIQELFYFLSISFLSGFFFFFLLSTTLILKFMHYPLGFLLIFKYN